jgi:hypothetical protein
VERMDWQRKVDCMREDGEAFRIDMRVKREYCACRRAAFDDTQKQRLHVFAFSCKMRSKVTIPHY